MTTRAGIDALLFEDAQLRQAHRRAHAVGGDRHAGLARGARGGAVHPLLLGADPRLVGPDLPDDPRPHTRAGDAVSQLPDHLGCQLIDAAPVDQGFLRVVGLAIPAATHHDLDARPACQAPQALRVAADARRGELHQRRAAAPPVIAQLVGDEVLVGGELPVVPSALDVPEVDAGVLVRKGEADSLGWDRPTDGHDSRSHRVPPVVDWAPVGVQVPPEPGLEWTGQVCHRAAAAERVASLRTGCRRSPGDGMLTARAAPAAP